MKFKHISPEIKDTEGIGITHPGDIVTETRPERIRELLINPFFEVVKERPVKKDKKLMEE